MRAPGLAQFGWLAAILLIPILGPAAWFVFGRASQLAAIRFDRVGVTAN
ncbi:PLDc N-terminal domain-containing protein [Demequina aurantiaca]